MFKAPECVVDVGDDLLGDNIAVGSKVSIDSQFFCAARGQGEVGKEHGGDENRSGKGAYKADYITQVLELPHGPNRTTTPSQQSEVEA